MGRRQPEGGYTQGVQIIQLGLYSVEIAYSVAVAVGKTVDKQLIGDFALFLARSVGGYHYFVAVIGDGLRLFIAGCCQQRQQRQYKEQAFHIVIFKWDLQVRIRGLQAKIIAENDYSTVAVPALKLKVIF